MKYTLRKSYERGHVHFDWLKSAHSFSFGDYYDKENMGFGRLRVLNDDEILAGNGFPAHRHNNMEIFTIPLSGSLAHKDSMGNNSTIKPGDVQIMSAGTGVMHSEWNASNEESLTLLQIWITPKTIGLTPRYQEKHFSFLEDTEKLHTLISPTQEDSTLFINQDAYVSVGTWKTDTIVNYVPAIKNNGVYIFIIEGSAKINEITLERRDALMAEESDEVIINIYKDTMILIIEVPLT